MFICAMLFASRALLAQSSLLQSGPMVGYVEMREAALWAQTTQAARVYAEYRATTPDAPTLRTEEVTTNGVSGFTAHLLCDKVEPGIAYTYSLFINGQKAARPYPTTFSTPPLWQYRTDPPAMKIAVGSCTYINEEKYDRPGKGYGGEYGIFTALHAANPGLMVWLGDNIYLREVDFGSKTGVYHRYTHTRSIPEMQPFLANTAHIATWDDHDFGPNDSDGSYAHADITTQAFKDFWANPGYAQGAAKGIYTTYDYGDAQFVLLDGRSFRTASRRKTGNRTILGQAQKEWLLNTLASSGATFKFVCIGGQFLNDVAEFENHALVAPEEREEIMDFIAKEGIKNVIFLTGDRHHSELSMAEIEGIKMYDFTVSPLTSGAHDSESEKNSLRVPGSQIGVRNYGIMEFSGVRTARKLTLLLYDNTGKELWRHEISAVK